MATIVLAGAILGAAAEAQNEPSTLPNARIDEMRRLDLKREIERLQQDVDQKRGDDPQQRQRERWKAALKAQAKGQAQWNAAISKETDTLLNRSDLAPFYRSLASAEQSGAKQLRGQAVEANTNELTYIRYQQESGVASGYLFYGDRPIGYAIEQFPQANPPERRRGSATISPVNRGSDQSRVAFEIQFDDMPAMAPLTIDESIAEPGTSVLRSAIYGDERTGAAGPRKLLLNFIDGSTQRAQASTANNKTADAAGKYFLIFVARGGSLVEHGFVSWRRQSDEDPISIQKSYGIHPRVSASARTPDWGEVPEPVADEEFELGRRDNRETFIVAVSFDTFARALEANRQWASKPASDSTKASCVDFMDAIAKAASLTRPMMQSTDPTAYLQGLAALNDSAGKVGDSIRSRIDKAPADSLDSGVLDLMQQSHYWMMKRLELSNQSERDDRLSEMSRMLAQQQIIQAEHRRFFERGMPAQNRPARPSGEGPRQYIHVFRDLNDMRNQVTQRKAD